MAKGIDQIVALTLFGTLGGLALVSVVGNSVHIAKGERPREEWLAIGYVSAAFSGVAAGISAGTLKENAALVSGIHIGLAVLGLTTTIWSHALPKRKVPSVSIQPTIIPGAHGQPAFGLALTLPAF
ncbi:MAG: hypothetical protein HYY84_14395 [Deltaproteobacteria bacterium]|nr:hypothetical protein [Deltaproteobacteria bacterium]